MFKHYFGNYTSIKDEHGAVNKTEKFGAMATSRFDSPKWVVPSHIYRQNILAAEILGFLKLNAHTKRSVYRYNYFMLFSSQKRCVSKYLATVLIRNQFTPIIFINNLALYLTHFFKTIYSSHTTISLAGLPINNHTIVTNYMSVTF